MAMRAIQRSVEQLRSFALRMEGVSVFFNANELEFDVPVRGAERLIQFPLNRSQRLLIIQM